MTTSKVAIVTGGGSGVGRAAALALLRDGWNVVIAGRRPEPLQAVIEESKAGSRGLGVPTDVPYGLDYDTKQLRALRASAPAGEDRNDG